jgi:hypothetical protein
MELLRPLIHYGMHLLVPGLLAYLFFRDRWKRAWLIMLLTMLVDLDHLLATPIFAATRCSVGFHFLHSYYAIGVYFLMLLFKQARIVAVGLLLHMVADYLDCFFI